MSPSNQSSNSRSSSSSGSGSSSRSGSASSRSSSNSMKLPEATEQQPFSATTPTPPPAGAAPASLNPPQQLSDAAAEQSGDAAAGAAEVASIFVGLGPAARFIKKDELLDFMREKAMDPANITEVRMRGRCAFVDTTTVAEAQHLVATLNEQMYKDQCHMTVQFSKHSRSEAAAVSNRRERASATTHSAPPILFIGMGPAGSSITDAAIRQKIEEAGPIVSFRRSGQCVFVEVASTEEADHMIATLHNQYLGEARLSVQFSRENRKRRRDIQGGPPATRREDIRRRGRHDRRDDHRDDYRDDYRRGSSRYGRSGDDRRDDRRDENRRSRRSRRSVSSGSSRSFSSNSSRGRRRHRRSSRSPSSHSSYSNDSRDRRDRRRGGRRDRR